MRKFLIVAGAVLAATAGSTAAQVPSSPTIVREATPAEATLHRLVGAINGQTDRAAFVNEVFSSGAFKDESADSRSKWLDKLAADSGGMTVVSVKSNGERMVEAIVRTRHHARFGKFVLFTSEDLQPVPVARAGPGEDRGRGVADGTASAGADRV